MAIKVNGKVVAGAGKSAYESAQDGGYTGTEDEFNAGLAGVAGVSGIFDGATTPQAALANLGGFPRRNLLDNWYFVGGGSQQGGGKLPVNQRRQSSYTGQGHTIDRWYGSNITTTLHGDKLEVVGIYGYGNISQTVENLSDFSGKQVTFSALITGGSGVANGAYIDVYGNDTDLYVAPINSLGLISCTFVLPVTLNSLSFGLATSHQAGKSLEVRAAKVEFGSTQTLARQLEDGTWELLDRPNYAEELAKCQRYLITDNTGAYISGAMYSTTEGVFTVPVPEMRTTPVLSGAKSTGMYLCDSSTIPNSALTFTMLRTGPAGCVIKATSSQPATIGPAVLSDFAGVFDANL